MSKSNKKIQKIDWSDICTEIEVLNPRLAEEINRLPASKRYPFYRVRYQFADEIVKNGLFQVPALKNGLKPINDELLPRRIRDDLSYNFNSNPVCIPLNGSLELFIELQNRIIPYSLISAGQLFGSWKVLDPAVSHCPPVFCWGMTAGARSIFMLPKISDAVNHNRLKTQFGVTVSKPACLKDHWQVFKEVIQNEASELAWSTDLIFFSKKWFDHLREKPWQGLYNYFLQQAWDGSQFWRNKYMWGLTFTRIQARKIIKPNPFIDHVVRHLLMVGVGALPGFVPAIDDSAGPIDYLQKVYTDVYQLKNYQPILMQPQKFKFNDDNARPVYLSCQYPSALELQPRTAVRMSAITDLHDIRILLEQYLDAIHSGHLNIDTTPLSMQPVKVGYDLFHSNPQNYKGIRHVQDIPLEDQTFFQFEEYERNKEFPVPSPFFKGCIRIKRK